MKSIRALRQERAWTQFELALRVGVQPQAVYLWESGRRTPHVTQLRKLGQLFGICSDDIFVASPRASTPATGRRARAGRQQGERSPGRDGEGPAVARGRNAAAAGRDDP